MILIGRLISPGVRRVAVVCASLGVPYGLREVSAITQQDEVRRYNPLGRMPALELDDGEVLIESGAILCCAPCSRIPPARALRAAPGAVHALRGAGRVLRRTAPS